jgi:hypothetical protein
MAAKYILSVLSVLFLGMGIARATRGGTHPQSRTWLLIGVIFAVVSAWLFYKG